MTTAANVEKRKKVRFEEDVVESSLRKLSKKEHDLLQRLESIVSGHIAEDEEFDYLLLTREANSY